MTIHELINNLLDFAENQRDGIATELYVERGVLSLELDGVDFEPIYETDVAANDNRPSGFAVKLY